jgi:subtilisin family serine protease
MAALALLVGAACTPVIVSPPAALPPAGDCAPLPGADALTVPVSEPDPLTVSQAGAKATQAAATTTSASNGAVTLVTAEQDANGGLTIQSHATTKAQAASVAKAAAVDGDLVAVDVPHAISTQAVQTTATDPMRNQQWALNDVHFESVWTRHSGLGVTVAVVDTGIQANHPDLVGHVLSGAQFTGNTGVSSGNGQVDGFGHGTHVAGIIAAASSNAIGVSGAAPGASLLPVRVLDNDGSGYDTDVARGIDWATSHGAKIINLSLGGPSASTVLQASITNAVAHGVTVVAAAGNSGPNTPPSYPGAFPNVIAVAAVDRTNAVASFSTRGAYVDVAAPGVDILSTYKGSLYATMSGTSMATPYTTAALALLAQERPTWTPTQLQARLEATATHLGAAGKNPATGMGLINPRGAVGC